VIVGCGFGGLFGSRLITGLPPAAVPEPIAPDTPAASSAAEHRR
jgi:hypothetical protein